jgi:KaiC/GvpD/RAD55 family RecA-like ATPase
MNYKDFINHCQVAEVEEALKSSIGKLMVISGKNGIGKTGVIVQVAIDHMLQGEDIIHISFANRVDHILEWYDTIFYELAQAAGLDRHNLREEMGHRRMLLHFVQKPDSIAKLIENINAVRASLMPDIRILCIDGFNFTAGDPKEIAELKNNAKKNGFQIWTTIDSENEATIGPYESLIDAHLYMREEGGNIDLHLRTPDAGALKVKLDPKTFLLKSLK